MIERRWVRVSQLMVSKKNSRKKSDAVERTKPKALRSGDTIGIVAPASNIKPAELEAGCEALRRAGYQPFFFDSILEQDLYFAGSVSRRIDELNQMFEREDIRAILCARGGYGSNYLLEEFDLKELKSHPKIFIGYSDITSLLSWFGDSGHLVTFHGPMAAKDWAHAGGVEMESWQSALSRTSAWDVPLGDEVAGLVDGEAQGILAGGCLSILVAALETAYELDTRGTILFLEDVAAKPFQIDRMLMQLKLAGKFDNVRGIVFGVMLDCVQTANQSYTLQEVVTRVVGELEVPVAFGVRSGHVTSRNITLPFGVRAALAVDGGSVSLRILEASVRA
ncbi:MAG TPA: LD-carboxypeptidase [Candidatus Sulfotelmatobacter sp.]|nr:LD-carboxypeptidase [Candidatus Sulfotelmatobacter sp.]